MFDNIHKLIGCTCEKCNFNSGSKNRRLWSGSERRKQEDKRQLNILRLCSLNFGGAVYGVTRYYHIEVNIIQGQVF